ncbi:hypothetical protein C8J56DRAFT_1062609 [Mycena floridula]|nr:hypothetical protein C8J56DRAFT_1062609 [Mycena floridula]
MSNEPSSNPVALSSVSRRAVSLPPVATMGPESSNPSSPVRRPSATPNPKSTLDFLLDDIPSKEPEVPGDKDFAFEGASAILDGLKPPSREASVQSSQASAHSRVPLPAPRSPAPILSDSSSMHHDLSSEPPTWIPKDLDLWDDPRRAAALARRAAYHAILDMAQPMAPDVADTLPLVADDLNHILYAAAHNWMRLISSSDVSLRVACLTQICECMRIQNDWVLSGLCRTCDFPESTYAKLFRTTVLDYLEEGNIPTHLLPHSIAELSAGLLLDDDEDLVNTRAKGPWRALPPKQPDYGDARHSLRVRQNHLQKIYHRPDILSSSGQLIPCGPGMTAHNLLSTLFEFHRLDELRRRGSRSLSLDGEESDANNDLAAMPSSAFRCPPVSAVSQHRLATYEPNDDGDSSRWTKQRRPDGAGVHLPQLRDTSHLVDPDNIPEGYQASREPRIKSLVVPSFAHLANLSPPACSQCESAGVPCAPSLELGEACFTCKSSSNVNCAHTAWIGDVFSEQSRLYDSNEANMHRLADILEQVERLQTRTTTHSILLTDELEELQGLKQKWFELYIKLGSLASGPPILTLIPYDFFTATIRPALQFLNQDNLLYRMQHAYHYWGLEAHGVPTPSRRSRLQIFLSRQARLDPAPFSGPANAKPSKRKAQAALHRLRKTRARKSTAVRKSSRSKKGRRGARKSKGSSSKSVAFENNNVEEVIDEEEDNVEEEEEVLPKSSKSSTVSKSPAPKAKTKPSVAKKTPVEEPESSGEEESSAELAASEAPSDEESDDSHKSGPDDSDESDEGVEVEPTAKKPASKVKPLSKVSAPKQVIPKVAKASAIKPKPPKASTKPSGKAKSVAAPVESTSDEDAMSGENDDEREDIDEAPQQKGKTVRRPVLFIEITKRPPPSKPTAAKTAKPSLVTRPPVKRKLVEPSESEASDSPMPDAKRHHKRRKVSPLESSPTPSLHWLPAAKSSHRSDCYTPESQRLVDEAEAKKEKKRLACQRKQLAAAAETMPLTLSAARMMAKMDAEEEAANRRSSITNVVNVASLKGLPVGPPRRAAKPSPGKASSSKDKLVASPSGKMAVDSSKQKKDKGDNDKGVGSSKSRQR